MSWDSKVVWSEGMFLRTLHFQQQARYTEKLVRGRVDALRPYSWGLTELQINQELLTTGKFAVASCRGVLPDGTPFNVPEDIAHPPPLELPENTRDCLVYLTLPVRQPGGLEVDAADQEETVARYAATEFEAVDVNAGSETVAPIEVGKLRLRYRLATDELAGYVCLGLARVVELRADKNIVMDDRYIPPVLDCASSNALAGFISELQGVFHHRGEALASQLGQAGTRGTSEIVDFLTLQAVNRYEPLLIHFAAAENLHPERFYAAALQMAGEFATLIGKKKRPTTFPEYRHDDLQATFTPVIDDLRRSLSAVLEVTAVPIPLQERKHGVRVGKITDRGLVASATFVLAVKADMKSESLRKHFPRFVKIASVEKIRDIVLSQLSGIVVRALEVAPRQIPFHAGFTYFELDRGGRSAEYWKSLATSGGMAIALAGEFPKVEMECWAIRDQ